MNSKILVVEDVPEMAELASMYLTKSGMKVEAVGSAEEALEYIQKQLQQSQEVHYRIPGNGSGSGNLV